MSGRILIALGSQARVGKSTAAEYILRRYGGVELSFAEPLKNILTYAQDVCGFEHEKDRQFLQFIGTDWARNKNPDVWLDIFTNRFREFSENTNVVVSDVRFPNEFYRLSSLGFKTVKIVRGSADSDKSFGNGTRFHPSENAISDVVWKFWVRNNGTFEDLYTQLDRIISFEEGDLSTNTLTKEFPSQEDEERNFAQDSDLSKSV